MSAKIPTVTFPVAPEARKLKRLLKDPATRRRTLAGLAVTAKKKNGAK